MTFEERHAQVSDDPLEELHRRLQPWAAAPDSRGQPLHAAIVPLKTIAGAIELLTQHRALIDAMSKAKTIGNA